jgi:hypothetical protein
VDLKIPYLHIRVKYWHDNFIRSDMKWLRHFFNIFYYSPGGSDALYAMKLHRNYERRRAKLRKRIYNRK